MPARLKLLHDSYTLCSLSADLHSLSSQRTGAPILESLAVSPQQERDSHLLQVTVRHGTTSLAPTFWQLDPLH